VREEMETMETLPLAEECGKYVKVYMPTFVLRIPKTNVKRLTGRKVLIKSPLSRKEFVAYLL
jgi:hypothetical protein